MFDPMKTFLKFPMLVRLSIAAFVVASMVILILWMAGNEMDQEPTFLEVCWKDGVAHYSENEEQVASCPAGIKALKWGKTPKTVRWNLEQDYDVYLDSHKRAMQWVNNELGFEALRPTSDLHADIILSSGSYGGEGAMHTSHYRITAGGDIHASIVVNAPGDTRQWMLEEQHELLHALGLAHDRRGIMSLSLDEPGGPRVWLLHSKDKKALRDLLVP